MQTIDLKGNDQLHLSVHGRVIQEGEVNEWSDEQRDILLGHMAQHIQRIQIQQQQAAQQQQQLQGGANAGQPGGAGPQLPNSPNPSQEVGQDQGVQGRPGVPQFI